MKVLLTLQIDKKKDNYKDYMELILHAKQMRYTRNMQEFFENNEKNPNFAPVFKRRYTKRS